MDVTRRVLSMNFDRCGRRGRPKKRWMDYVKHVMNVKTVNSEMTSDRDEWKKKTYCAELT